MKQEINPKETNRAIAFELWMKSPMPMVTVTKTFDVTRLCKVSRRRGLKFNMLLCWCIGKAASGIEEFYMLPQYGKVYKYDCMAINVIVDNAQERVQHRCIHKLGIVVRIVHFQYLLHIGGKDI